VGSRLAFLEQHRDLASSVWQSSFSGSNGFLQKKIFGQGKAFQWPVMIIWRIVIIINSVLTLQVSTAKPMIADLVE
jgi:hypothetical protein